MILPFAVYVNMFYNIVFLQRTNPGVTLPEKRIRPVARTEKSGTTEILTRALSSFSQEWRREYGIFSQGTVLKTPGFAC